MKTLENLKHFMASSEAHSQHLLHACRRAVQAYVHASNKVREVTSPSYTAASLVLP